MGLTRVKCCHRERGEAGEGVGENVESESRILYEVEEQKQIIADCSRFSIVEDTLQYSIVVDQYYRCTGVQEYRCLVY